MAYPRGHRKVLLTAADDVRLWLSDALQRILFGWEFAHADSLEQAALLSRHATCDVILLDQTALETSTRAILTTLAAGQEPPILLLADLPGEEVNLALECGVQQWLPRDFGFLYPARLATTLEQLAGQADLRRHARRSEEALQECRRQVTRLVDMVSSKNTTASRPHWLAQPHLLERLGEELVRIDRYGGTLSIVLGELAVETDRRLPTAPLLDGSRIQRVCHTIRRCDAAGPYGPNAFLVLLPQTPTPGAATFCQRLGQSLAETAADNAMRFHSHFGIATHSPETLTAKGLLRRAEEQLERAKLEPPQWSARN